MHLKRRYIIMKGPSNKPRTLFEITIVVLVSFAVLLLLDRGLSAKESPDIKFETYVWRNLSSGTLEPPINNDDAYLPIVLKISDDVEKQTGISLEKIVNQSGKVIFNFYYTGSSPTVSGYCDLVEIIITTSDGRLIENYLLRFTNGELKLETT